MNRRKFFNKLGSFVVGCYLASGLKPLDKIVPKEETISIINQEWINAPYEIAFYYSSKDSNNVLPVTYKRSSEGLENLKNQFIGEIRIVKDEFPMRMNEKGEILCPIK